LDPPGNDSAATYEIAQRDAHVHVTLRGRPRVETVVSMFRALEELTAGDGELLVLIDESEMTAGLLGPAELSEMMDALKSSTGLRRRSRIAVCAPSLLVYGLNRMAQAFAGQASEGRLEVFRTVDEARAWLLGHAR